MLGIYLFTSDTEQGFFVRVWGTLFISLGFLYQNYILSSVCNVTYKWKFLRISALNDTATIAYFHL